MVATMAAVNAVTRPPDSQDGRHPPDKDMIRASAQNICVILIIQKTAVDKDVIRASARNICVILIIQKTAVVILLTPTEPGTAKKLADRSDADVRKAVAEAA